MSLLLPQTRSGTILRAAQVEIHGDRYLDVSIALDDSASSTVTGRVGAMECPADLAEGERVNVRITMGVITRLTRS